MKDNSIARQLQISESVLDFEAGYNRDFVERLLGRRNGRQLSRTTGKRLEHWAAQLPQLVAPRLTYSLVGMGKVGSGKVRFPSGLAFESPKLAWALKKAELLVCFVATLGDTLDSTIDSLMEQGQLADAYVVDTLGSGAVEWVADRFQDQIEADFREQGLVAGLRFSPGYCDWRIDEQPKLFRFFDSSAIGVSLGDTCLMHPRKSVSAVFGLYPASAKPQSRHMIPCLRCAKKDCIARRVDSES